MSNGVKTNPRTPKLTQKTILGFLDSDFQKQPHLLSRISYGSLTSPHKGKVPKKVASIQVLMIAIFMFAGEVSARTLTIIP